MQSERRFGVVVLGLAAAALLVIGGLAYKFSHNSPSSTEVYENQYLRVAVSPGWIARQGTTSFYEGSCASPKENCTRTLKTEPEPGIVNIAKDAYVLHINAKALQASGAEGGRFYEISGGVPSVDAVVIDPGQGPCGTSEVHPGFGTHSRIDLYVNKQETRSQCAAPTDGSTVWFFSYIAGNGNAPGGGYFNYYENGPISEGMGYIITMSYDSKDINNLPRKDNPQLNEALSQMTNMLDTLEIKRK